MSRMIKTAKPYEFVQGMTPYKTAHNVSYQTTTTGEMGVLYPNYWETLVPGDKVQLGAEAVIRLSPMLAPLMHQVDVHMRWYAVPYRLLWRGDKWYNLWELFITGSLEGKELSKYNDERPAGERITYPDINELGWDPKDKIKADGTKETRDGTAIGAEIGTVWEAIGLPSKNQISFTGDIAKENMPNSWVKRAYNKIWNDWFRDENLQDVVDLNNDTLLRKNWERDYFTSAGYDQQKGSAPQIGLGILKHEFTSLDTAGGMGGISGINASTTHISSADGLRINTQGKLEGTQPTDSLYGYNVLGAGPGQPAPKQGEISLADHQAFAFGMNDLRLLTAVQKMHELDMRAGTRYIEFLQANYNASPRDERLQLAEYIGSEKMAINVSEVLSTQGDTTGEMYGHGIGYTQAKNKHMYYAEEHCVVIGLVCIEPKTQYQQGIPKQLWYKDKYEYYRPQMAYLGEQEIRSGELYWTGDGNEVNGDKSVFGFQGRWDEMRLRDNRVMGLMRADENQNLSYWNLARIFDNRPKLNSEFVTMTPRKDIYQIPSEPAFILTVGWHAYAQRPIPRTSEPGLLDHTYGEGSGNNMVRRGGRRF